MAMTYFVPFLTRVAFPTFKTSFQPCLEYARKVKADLLPGGYQSINLCAQPAVEGCLMHIPVRMSLRSATTRGTCVKAFSRPLEASNAILRRLKDM
jgi:hypothetical protein